MSNVTAALVVLAIVIGAGSYVTLSDQLDQTAQTWGCEAANTMEEVGGEPVEPEDCRPRLAPVDSPGTGANVPEGLDDPCDRWAREGYPEGAAGFDQCRADNPCLMPEDGSETHPKYCLEPEPEPEPKPEPKPDCAANPSAPGCEKPKPDCTKTPNAPGCAKPPTGCVKNPNAPQCKPDPAKTFETCDPFTGERRTESVEEYLADGGTDPGDQQSFDDSVIGKIWTAACEPTNTTGNGSCILKEVAEESTRSVEFTCDALGSEQVAPKLKLVNVTVVLRQTLNDGRTDFLVFSMLVPEVAVDILKAGGDPATAIDPNTGKPIGSGAITGIFADVALYRTRDNPTKPGQVSTEEFDDKLHSFSSQSNTIFGTDSTVLGVDPFLKGSFRGYGAVGALQRLTGAPLGTQGQGGLSLGGQFWSVTDGTVDTHVANPDNFDVPRPEPSPLPGGGTADNSILPLDIRKFQPNGDGLNGALKLPDIPGVDPKCAAKLVTWDQMDVAVVSDAVGKPQSATLEAVGRFPVSCAVDGKLPLPTVGSKGKGKLGVEASGYLAFRYISRVDLAGRTPQSDADLENVCGLLTTNLAEAFETKTDASEAWQDKNCPKDPDGNAFGWISDSFGPDRNSGIHLYAGYGGKFGGGVGGGSGTGVDSSVDWSAREHHLLGSWYNTPEAAAEGRTEYKVWETCKDRYASEDDPQYGDEDNPAISPEDRASAAPASFTPTDAVADAPLEGARFEPAGGLGSQRVSDEVVGAVTNQVAGQGNDTVVTGASLSIDLPVLHMVEPAAA
ncbi:MAG: hypothetical protein ACRCYQ_06005, partial [Nocardioides sp.]